MSAPYRKYSDGVCLSCGTIFPRVNANHKRCDECAPINARKGKRAWERASKAWLNPETKKQHAKRQASYRADDPERYANVIKQYKQRHPDRVAVRQAASNAKRRALLKERTCSCCDRDTFHSIYEFARIGGFHVDHILALSLGGMHCEKNLQLLTPEANLEKARMERTLSHQLSRSDASEVS